MSWTIAGKYVRASATDPDAQAYLQAVEAADGQALEFEVARAIDNFVLGCKADGIWDAIKASCILAGARTLTGALVPLVGTAPTNFNFVSGDYNRKTGLVGDGSTKYLDSNRADSADPQNNFHASVYASVAATGTHAYLAGSPTSAPSSQTLIARNNSTNSIDFRCRSDSSGILAGSPGQSLFLGISRSVSTNFSVRQNTSTTSASKSSGTPASDNILVFARNTSPVGLYSDARLAFYSIGESLNLALLDARVTDLINAFDTAIPS
jgi:hypothetical protein